MKSLTAETAAAVSAVIDAHARELSRIRNFLGAEPGFPVVDGRLVREPAIIVYVSEKLPPSRLLAHEMAPASLDGVQVDVIEADVVKQLELTPLGRAFAMEVQRAALSRLEYEPLPGNLIDKSYPVSRPLLCHAGPDAGWTTLRNFIADTSERLVVAMYDFNADYIATTLIDAFEGSDCTIELTLDDGVEARESAIQSRIKSRLGAQYSVEIVRCGGSRRFPSAYHPKVAVQDGKRFWLSSGNWSLRSQPEIDPIGEPATAKGMYGKGNREWHVIVEDQTLAELFESYIRHDKKTAFGDRDAGLGAATRVSPPDVFVSIDDFAAEFTTAALAPPVPTPPALLPAAPREVEIRPLLSPDNYAQRVSEWALSAKRSLHLQYSYITYSTQPADAKFRAFLDALAELSWKDGFDLKIITGRHGDARELSERGFNDAVLRLQSGVHNKGIILDGREALVSSQNWSSDGFLRNRDAGLIIRDEEIAGYFAALFDHDWNDRSRDPFATRAVTAMIAPPGVSPPPGMMRMRWSDFMGD